MNIYAIYLLRIYHEKHNYSEIVHILYDDRPLHHNAGILFKQILITSKMKIQESTLTITVNNIFKLKCFTYPRIQE